MFTIVNRNISRLAMVATLAAIAVGTLLAPVTTATAAENPSKEEILAGVAGMLGFVPTFHADAEGHAAHRDRRL